MHSDTCTRSDLDQLIALNRDYVDSVQRGDVARFDAILAEDFRARTLTDRWSTSDSSWSRPRGL